MRVSRLLTVALILFAHSSPAADIECKTWFDNSKINASAKDCLDKCTALGVDMGTFTCPMSCKDFYGNPKYFHTLCKNEVVLCALDPSVMLQSYELANEAVEKTKLIFGRNGWKDESDAFRHFYWSALLTHRFGSTVAKIVTDAHESCSRSNLDSDMDLYNNSLGIDAALKHSIDDLLQIAEDYFKAKRFNIIKPHIDFNLNDENWR